MNDTFWRIDGDDVLLSIRLTPRSAREKVGGIWRDEKDHSWLQVQVRAVPEKGKANAALIQLMAKALHLASSAVSLEAGDTSRLKRVRVSGNRTQIETIMKEWMTS